MIADQSFLAVFGLALAGARFIGRWLSAHVLARVLAGVVAITAWATAMRSKPQLGPQDRASQVALGTPALELVGDGVGCVSTLVGIGGALTVPVLHLLGTRMRGAIGASFPLGMAITLPGALSLAIAIAGARAERLPPGGVSYVNLVAAAMLSACGSVGVSTGAKLATRMDPTVLRCLFTPLLALSAMRMVLAIA